LKEEKLLLIIDLLTKKFKFINKVEVFSTFNINRKLLEIIAQNCLNLKEIKFNANKFEEYYEVFGHEFEQKLELVEINGINSEEMVSILRSTHNLKSIEISGNFEALIEQYLPKLEEIVF
jgi:hypothetical protein